jgi:hypothetical protein
MTQAKHADKNFVRQFGKFLEEFRRENSYMAEIIQSDYNQAPFVPESMVKHTEKVNMGD